jgi:hypothetical protein
VHRLVCRVKWLLWRARPNRPPAVSKIHNLLAQVSELGAGIVFGPPTLRHDPAGSRGVTLTFPIDPGRMSGANTVVLRWRSFGPLNGLVHSLAGEYLGTFQLRPSELMSDLAASVTVHRRLQSLGIGPVDAMIPLFYVATQRTPGHPTAMMMTYSQIAITDDTLTFLRTGTDEAPSATPHDCIALATANHAAKSRQLNNLWIFDRLFKDQELEYKFTFAGDVDIYEITSRLYGEIDRGRIAKFILRPTNPFNPTERDFRFFEIVEPKSERGYITLDPNHRGEYMLKRKRFELDSALRGETVETGVVIDTTFEDYLTARFPKIKFRDLGGFKRIRYDVNFESLETGHIYGLMTDRCIPNDLRAVSLSQCELEYLNTRTVLVPSEDAVHAEMKQLCEWLARYFRKRGIRSDLGFYSKLSFLRELADGHSATLRTP